MLVACNERRRDLLLARSPDLFDGVETRRVWRKMNETDIVVGVNGGVLPHPIPLIYVLEGCGNANDGGIFNGQRSCDKTGKVSDPL